MAKNNLVPFYKMTGGGNDFVLLDNRKKTLGQDYPALAKKRCERKFSIGADGLLVLEESKSLDFRMVYYNSDGSRAEMCGNGARCIARFAHLLKAVPAKMSFDTDAGALSAEVSDQSVKLKMSPPKDLRLDFPLKLEEGKEIDLSFINTGVPHAVVLVTDLEKTEVVNLGRAIRYHKEFSPAGTNTNFVTARDPHHLVVRTYERGVEDETLACGTGIVASSLICAAKGMAKSPVSCMTRGGETMRVYFQAVEDRRGDSRGAKTVFTEVYLEGPATVCFQGEVEV